MQNYNSAACWVWRLSPTYRRTDWKFLILGFCSWHSMYNFVFWVWAVLNIGILQCFGKHCSYYLYHSYSPWGWQLQSLLKCWTNPNTGHGLYTKDKVLYTLRVSENRILGRIFVPNRATLKAGRRKPHNEELHKLYFSENIVLQLWNQGEWDRQHM
jgi:hypothetical protein